MQSSAQTEVNVQSQYPEPVWRLFSETPRGGVLPNGPRVYAAEVGTPAGRFRLRLYCQLDEQGRVSASRFQAYGCPYTIAVGSWLAQWCEGRQIAELAEFEVDQMRAALELPEDRAHCWLMAQDVLREIEQEWS